MGRRSLSSRSRGPGTCLAVSIREGLVRPQGPGDWRAGQGWSPRGLDTSFEGRLLFEGDSKGAITSWPMGEGGDPAPIWERASYRPWVASYPRALEKLD